jgi:hypothetical protein
MHSGGSQQGSLWIRARLPGIVREALCACLPLVDAEVLLGQFDRTREHDLVCPELNSGCIGSIRPLCAIDSQSTLGNDCAAIVQYPEHRGVLRRDHEHHRA